MIHAAILIPKDRPAHREDVTTFVKVSTHIVMNDEQVTTEHLPETVPFRRDAIAMARLHTETVRQIDQERMTRKSLLSTKAWSV